MTVTTKDHSQAPWGYQYSPYTVRTAETGELLDTIGKEIPAYEIFDAEGNKVFDTNEDTPADLQESNARLGTAAPALLAACRMVVDRWERGDIAEAARACSDAIAEAT